MALKETPECFISGLRALSIAFVEIPSKIAQTEEDQERAKIFKEQERIYREFVAFAVESLSLASSIPYALDIIRNETFMFMQSSKHWESFRDLTLARHEASQRGTPETDSVCGETHARVSEAVLSVEDAD